jgi:phosphoenolpyruvate carboxykinase (ATP)
MRYAALLGSKLAAHRAGCWLVNTGWSGGPYGIGRRMDIEVSRAIVTAIQAGALDEVRCSSDNLFGLPVPQSCPGVPSKLLDPRGTWPDPGQYSTKASELARLFQANFDAYAAECSPEVRAAGPK